MHGGFLPTAPRLLLTSLSTQRYLYLRGPSARIPPLYTTIEPMPSLTIQLISTSSSTNLFMTVTSTFFYLSPTFSIFSSPSTPSTTLLFVNCTELSNGKQIFAPEALNCFTFFCSLLSILSVPRSPVSILLRL